MTDQNLNIQTSSLFWWNFPETPDHFCTTDNGYTEEVAYFIDTGQVISESINKDTPKKTNPTMIYYLNRRIKDLDNLTYSESEQQQLNSTGIDFYLWEPLCYATIDDPNEPNWDYHGTWNMGFYAEFHHTQQNKNIICAELDSIYNWAKRNNLNTVKVHTCDYRTGEIDELYADRLEIVCNDVFLQYRQRNQSLWPEKIEKHIEKTFLSLTWRFTPSRWLTNCLLSKYSTDMVWAYKTQTDFFKLCDDTAWLPQSVLQHYPQDYQNDLLTGSRRLNLQVPLSLDIKIHKAHDIEDLRGDRWPKYTANYDEANPSYMNFVTFPLRKYYDRCFVDVVAETRYAQPTANVSEKILQTMMHKTPFIMVAPAFSLEYLRHLGYKTFNDFWDESYDTEEDHANRLYKIYHLFEELDQLSHKEMTDMYAEMKPILEHNHNVYMDSAPNVGKCPENLRKIHQQKHTEIQWTQTGPQENT